LAERIGHPHSLACALTYGALACQSRRDARCTLEWADKCIALSDEHGFRLWSALSTLLRSWALSELGKPEDGLALMQQALAHWRASGIPAGMHYHLGMLAEIYLRLGQPRQALEALDDALNFVERVGEGAYTGELHRLRGKALYKLGREEEGSKCFRQAIRIAREQGARAYERYARESMALWPSGAWLPEQALQSG
jgi:tetratricopeptide (TPR) repeat protein